NRRDPRCERRVLCFGQAAVQHDDVDGASDPQHSAVVRAVRARGHRRAYPRQDFAASKTKGMWMGGVPSLGYRAQDGKLEGPPDVIPSEACYLGWQESLRNLARLVE